MTRFGVLLFPSSNYAFFAKKLLISQKIKVKLIPVPRRFSSNCGICVRVKSQDLQQAENHLTELGVPLEECHLLV